MPPNDLIDLFESSIDTYFIATLDGVVLRSNPVGHALFGFPQDTNKPSVNLLDMCANHAERSHLVDLLRTCIEYTGVGPEDLVVRAGDKLPRYIKLELIKINEKTTPLLLGVARDQTEHFHTQKALIASEERYRIVSDMISSYAYSVRVTEENALELEWITDAFIQITGLEAGKNLPNQWPEFTHPDDHAKTFQSYADALVGIESSTEFRLRNVQGDYRWIRSFVRPVVDETSGRVIQIYGAGQDITDEVHIAKKLEEALKTTQKADAAKRNFLANMSHELRTPLTAILGYTELVMDELQDEGNKQHASDLMKVRQAAYHLSVLIGDILEMTNLEAGSAAPEISEFDIKLLIEDAIVQIRPEVDAHHNTLEMFCDGDHTVMMSDQDKVFQIIHNLLSNAAKFTKNGKIDVRARCIEEMDGYSLLIEVEDTGIGIAPDQLDTIFEPFQQGDNSSTRAYGGTGLGLAISYNYVQILNGSISVQSELGKGSIFSLRLPFTP